MDRIQTYSTVSDLLTETNITYIHIIGFYEYCKGKGGKNVSLRPLGCS